MQSLFLGSLAVLSLAGAALATPPARSQLLTTAVPFPICIASTPADPQHIYVCGRMGGVRIIDKDSGAATPGFFLNLTGQVSVEQDNGILGFCFDPDYDTNGYFYVNYRHTDGNIVLARYHAAPGATTADAGSAYTILRYPRNLGHNGGWIGFSPINNLLYITSGDGDLGGTLDFAQRAQNTVNMLWGKILRIDPRSDDFPADPDRNYHIPADNPFVNAPGDDEIWAYGVRNPWRASFDRMTGAFYFGDVGMDAYEEVNIENALSPGGRNYGWPCMEGAHCTVSTQCVCNDPALTDPVYDYPHPDGVAVIGGYVYRGSAIPAFQGLYFFGDFLAKIWSFRPVGDEGIAELTDRSIEFIPPGTTRPISFINAFGEDADGELYVADIYSSKVYKIVPYPCTPTVDLLSLPVSRPERAPTIALNVIGSGADPISFQWFKDNVELSDSARISGSDTPTLTISSAVIADTGLYTVVLSSPCGITTSDPVPVTIFACQSADFNLNGTINIDDLFSYLNAWFAGTPNADFNHDSTLEVQDIFDFLNSWFINCP